MFEQARQRPGGASVEGRPGDDGQGECGPDEGARPAFGGGELCASLRRTRSRDSGMAGEVVPLMSRCHGAVSRVDWLNDG